MAGVTLVGDKRQRHECVKLIIVLFAAGIGVAKSKTSESYYETLTPTTTCPITQEQKSGFSF